MHSPTFSCLSSSPHTPPSTQIASSPTSVPYPMLFVVEADSLDLKQPCDTRTVTWPFCIPPFLICKIKTLWVLKKKKIKKNSY